MKTNNGNVQLQKMTDGYQCHLRQWGNNDANDVILILHGGISHSLWQFPLAEAIVKNLDVSFVAMDRRGSGLNKDRGQMVSKQREIEDVAEVITALKRKYERIHLAGWCFGGQVASLVASELEITGTLSSLILIAPGFAFTERYADSLNFSTEAVFSALNYYNVLASDEDCFLSLPLRPKDFTDEDDWIEFVQNDPLLLEKFTKKTLDVWYEIAEASTLAISNIKKIPVIAVFGEKERIVDIRKTEQIFREKIVDTPLKIVRLDAQHAIQFDKTEELANTVVEFIKSV